MDPMDRNHRVRKGKRDARKLRVYLPPSKNDSNILEYATEHAQGYGSAPHKFAAIARTSHGLRLGPYANAAGSVGAHNSVISAEIILMDRSFHLNSLKLEGSTVAVARDPSAGNHYSRSSDDIVGLMKSLGVKYLIYREKDGTVRKEVL